MNKGTEMLLKIIEKEGTNERGTCVMDFSKKEHWDCLCEVFGGEEHLKNEYPIFYGKMLKTAQKSKEANDKLMDDDSSVVDTVYVRDVVSNAVNTGSSGLTCLRAPATQLFQSITLTQDGNEIGRNVQFASNRQVAVLDVCIDSSALVSKTSPIKSVYHSVWDDQTSGMLKAEIFKSQDITPLVDPVTSVEVVHPCYYHGNNMIHLTPVVANPSSKSEIIYPIIPPKPEGRTTINVVYRRSPEAGEVVDYNYPDKAFGTGKLMQQDIQVKVILDESHTFKTCTEAYALLEITGDEFISKNGSVFHQGNLKNPNNVYAFGEKKTEHGFCFLVPTSWECAIDPECIAGNKKYRLEVGIDYTCNEDDETHSISISSKPGVVQEEPHHATVPVMHLLWGCVKAGTMIALPDGTQKAVENIQIGDLVLDENLTAVKVTNKIQGTDRYMMHIDTVDGASIEVSMDHPLMTDHGNLPAGNIIPTHKLKMRDGAFHEIKYIYRKEGECQVYNLEMESDHWFIANGFITGDNLSQNVCLASANRKSWRQATPEEIAEIEKFNAEFGAK